MVLVLAAVLPMAFQRRGSRDEAERAKPAWQPENPAPDASLAPAWNEAATQVGEQVQPRDEAAPKPALPERDASFGTPDAPSSPSAGQYVAEVPQSSDPATDSAALTTWNSEDHGTTANRSHSIVPPGDAGMADGRTGYPERANWPEADRRDYPATINANREAAVPHVQPEYGGYREPYPSRPEPSQQRGYGGGGAPESYAQHGASGWDHSRTAAPPNHREPAQPYPTYRNDPPAAAWREPQYRATDPNAVQPRGYGAPATPGPEGRSAYYPPAGADNRYAPAGTDYRYQPAADNRYAPAGTDYRHQPAANYRAEPYPSNYGTAPQEPRAPGYAPHGREGGAYQPAPGYYDGGDTRPAPSGAAPYYQADRRYEAGAGYAPHGAQPGEAQFQGTIGQPPAPSRYDTGGSRVY